MEKTEMIAVETFQEIIRNQCDEISALKEKAAAYDLAVQENVAHEFTILQALKGRTDYEGLPVSELNWLQVLRREVEKAKAYDRLMSGVWHSGKERPTKTGWYCAVYTTIIISDDGKSTHTGKDELKIVQFHTKRDVWSYWFTNTRGRKIECNNVPKKWMAVPDGWEEA